jgi:chromosomal replication initiation ATPase DnaA
MRAGDRVSDPTSRFPQLALDLGHDPSHAADDYIVGAGNELAYDHIHAFPAWAHPLTLIEGPEGAGKSHLARIWAEVSGAAYAVPETAEDLAREGGQLPLVVDDMDRAPFAETALFHLLNQSMRDSRPLLMTARLPVSAWPFTTDDLKSRARLAQRFEVKLSSDIQLSQMFVKLFGDRQVSVEPKVIAFLVSRMEREPGEAVILADLMDRMALERGGPITRVIAAEALALRLGSAARNQLSLEFGDDADD